MEMAVFVVAYYDESYFYILFGRIYGNNKVAFVRMLEENIFECTQYNIF